MKRELSARRALGCTAALLAIVSASACETDWGAFIDTVARLDAVCVESYATRLVIGPGLRGQDRVFIPRFRSAARIPDGLRMSMKVVSLDGVATRSTPAPYVQLRARELRQARRDDGSLVPDVYEATVPAAQVVVPARTNALYTVEIRAWQPFAPVGGDGAPCHSRTFSQIPFPIDPPQ
jgi:hypothetical protein